MKKDKRQNEEYTMQDAFLREVDEDLKNESLKKLWDKYGVLITALVVVVLTMAVSYESLKAWYIRRAENWADAYAVALSLHNQGRYEDSMDALNMIVDNKYGAFADLAKMQQVDVLLDSQKEDKALALLEEIIADKKFSVQLRDVAIVKLASYRQDTSSLDEMHNLLRPILDNPQNAWYALAEDMIALTMIRDGDVDGAKRVYEKLLSNHDVSDDLKGRIKDILSVL